MRKNIIIIAVNVLVMVLLFVGVTVWVVPSWLNNLTGHGIFRTVPQVVGMDVTSAIELLESETFEPMIIDSIYADGKKPGAVIEQLPEGNLDVKPGRIVYLTINRYMTQTFSMPEVKGISMRQAVAYLHDVHFVLDSIVYEPADYDDLALAAINSADGKEMVTGKAYPKYTHVVLKVGSSQMNLEGTNDENEDVFFE